MSGIVKLVKYESIFILLLFFFETVDKSAN